MMATPDVLFGGWMEQFDIGGFVASGSVSMKSEVNTYHLEDVPGSRATRKLSPTDPESAPAHLI